MTPTDGLDPDALKLLALWQRFVRILTAEILKLVKEFIQHEQAAEQAQQRQKQ